jgi:hypothetical protein
VTFGVCRSTKDFPPPAILDECLKVWNGEAIARPLLATSHVDVAEFAVLHEGSDLIFGDVEIRRCSIDFQQPGIAGRLQGDLLAHVDAGGFGGLDRPDDIPVLELMWLVNHGTLCLINHL